MGALTNAAEDEVIKHIFRTGSWTKPTTLYVALFTAAPGEAGGGTEVTGGSYARVASTPGDANWAATVGGDGTTSNLAAITFPAPTADWGQATHWGIFFDEATAGTLRIYAALTTPKTINNGDAAPSFGVGALTYQSDN
jgi:hypothetical protein